MEKYIAVWLSTFAVVYLLKYTDGPFDIFARWRVYIGLDIHVINDVENYYYEKENTEGFIANLFKCFWCLSTWIALPIAIGYILLVDKLWVTFPFLWFSTIGTSGILKTVIIFLENHSEDMTNG